MELDSLSITWSTFTKVLHMASLEIRTELMLLENERRALEWFRCYPAFTLAESRSCYHNFVYQAGWLARWLI